jgi:hypothetical protein
VLAEDLEALFAVVGEEDFVVVPAEYLCQHEDEVFLVVDEEDLGA